MRTCRFVLLSLLITLLGVAPASSFKSEDTIYKAIKVPGDIENLDGRIVTPIAYTSVVSLSKLEVRTRKRKFYAMMLPAILISKERLRLKRERVSALLGKETLSAGDRTWIDLMKKTYRTQDTKELLPRLNDHPTSIVLAQAAIETGWGTSRFFQTANNVFGVWSYDTKEPRVKASKTRKGKAVYVKKYKSLIGSVDDYFLTIARGPYAGFRKERTGTQDVQKLVRHLSTYSEIRQVYVKRLRSIISYNKLSKYDSYVLAGE